MHLRGIISSKYADKLLGQINGIGLKFKESTLKAIRSQENGSHIRAELFQSNLAISCLGSCGYFYYICSKQKEVDLLDFEDVVLLSLHTIWHNGWAELDDRCQLLISRLLSHGSCDASLKWPVLCLSLSVPPHPSPSPPEPPLAGRTLSPGWSGSCWGCWAAGKGGRKVGGYTDLENTVNLPHHPPTPSYSPLSLLTLPHI